MAATERGSRATASSGRDGDGLQGVGLLEPLVGLSGLVDGRDGVAVLDAAVTVRLQAVQVHLMQGTRLVAVGAQSVKLRALEPGLQGWIPVPAESSEGRESRQASSAPKCVPRNGQ